MSFKRFVSVVLLASMSACMSTVRVAPADYLAQNQPLQMLVVDDLGDMYILEQPSVVDGNLQGIESGTPDMVSVPMSQVQEAMVRQKSPMKTAFLIGTLTVMTAASVVLAMNGGLGKPCKVIASNEYAFENGTNQCDVSGADGTATDR